MSDYHPCNGGDGCPNEGVIEELGGEWFCRDCYVDVMADRALDNMLSSPKTAAEYQRYVLNVKADVRDGILSPYTYPRSFDEWSGR